MSLALARKYRPSTFEDLIGQESISQTLSLALDGDRLSHAYLFSGLRGSGKTSTARIFAKALLCDKGATSHPCGECSSCVMSVQGSHMDIIEMDAASNRGIDDIKELIEHTKYQPSSGRYKIFIIDEVHMLTNQAFNALLKTLEEPPSFVKFILATTDPLKLPATILSRTQHFRFKKIPHNLVLRHLEHILNLENVEYEIEALEVLARSGAGSLRDSLTLLDQAIVYSKSFVNISTVTNMLGIIESSRLSTLVDDILNKDTQAILSFIELASDYEAEMILDELTLYLKELLLSNDTKLSPTIIGRFFRVIADSKHLLALGSDGDFVLSLSMFKMMESLQIKDIDHMIKSLEQELTGVTVAPPLQPTTSSISSVTSAKTKDFISEPIDNSTTKDEEKSIEVEEVKVEDIKKEDPKPIDPHIETFDKLIAKIYDRDYDLGECFKRNITFKEYLNSQLTWISTAKDNDKKSLITHWGLINMFVKEIFGTDTKIVNISQNSDTEETKKTEEAKQIEKTKQIEEIEKKDDNPEMKSSCVAPPAGGTEAAKEKDPSEILKEPMVVRAIEELDPKKVRIIRNS